MAHEIDQTTEQDSIAYVGETPWHGLGQQLLPGMPIDDWRDKAGLSYEVLRSPVCYTSDDISNIKHFNGHDVLYRSDTGAPLSVVSKNYKIVQPRDILDFFNKLSYIGGFDLEVAGVLSGGKRVWGLAKVGDGAPIIGQDIVRPYVLFATSYDGTMATVAKFTAIRVVCNNTITMAVGKGTNSVGKIESDIEGRAVSTMVRIPHSRTINADEIRQQLGIVSDVYERWMVNTRLLVEKTMDAFEAEQFVFDLVNSFTKTSGHKLPDVHKSKSYCRILELFNGELMGGELAGKNNKWVMLNAVSQFVDHERGNSPDTSLSGAWFGVGDAIKTKAYDILTLS